jgi:hypothetical protein
MASSSVTVIHTEGWMDEIVWSHQSMHTDNDFGGSNERMEYSDFRKEIASAAVQTEEEEARSMETFVRTVHAARTGSNVSGAQHLSMNDLARSRGIMSFAGTASVEEMSTLIRDATPAKAEPVTPQDRVDAESGDTTVLLVCNARQYRATNMTVD